MVSSWRITLLAAWCALAVLLSSCGEEGLAERYADELAMSSEESLARIEEKLADYPADCNAWELGPDGRGKDRAAMAGDVRAMECLWLWNRDEFYFGVQFGYMLLRATGEAPEGFEDLVRSHDHTTVASQLQHAHNGAAFLEPVIWLERERCYAMDEEAVAVLALADRGAVNHLLCSEQDNPYWTWPWPFHLLFG